MINSVTMEKDTCNLILSIKATFLSEFWRVELFSVCWPPQSSSVDPGTCPNYLSRACKQTVHGEIII